MALARVRCRGSRPPDDGSADLFVGEREMHKVLHGDRVMFRQVGMDRRGRPEGSIIEVIERVNQSVVARLYWPRKLELNLMTAIARLIRINTIT